MNAIRSRFTARTAWLFFGLSACGGGQPADAADHADALAPDSLPAVHLTTEQVAALGIVVDAVPPDTLGRVIERPATLLLDPDRVALIGPRIEAKVERVTRDLGDAVTPGTVLAIMSSVTLGQTKAQHLALKARLETARASYERARRLFEDRISSEANLLEAQARFEEARADVDVVHETLRLYGLSGDAIESIGPGSAEPLSFFPLTSPVAGVVQRRDLTPGQTVGPSETPIHVARLDRLWVMIDAYEHDVPALATGQAVTISFRSAPDRTFRAVTDWVSYELDPETRTVRVRAVVANPDGVLRAGMFGTASIHVHHDANHASVPVDAVQTLEGQTVVFVPGVEAGAFRAVLVRLGIETAGRVEVLAGLAPGDRIVVRGAFELMSAATAGTRDAGH